MRELWLVPSWRTNLPCRASPKGAAWLCFESELICKSTCSCNDHALISQTLEHLFSRTSCWERGATLVAQQHSHPQPLPLLRLHLESQCPKAADPYHAGFLTRHAAQQPAQMMKQTAALSTQSLRTQGVFPFFFSWKRTGKKSNTAGDEGDESRSRIKK